MQAWFRRGWPRGLFCAVLRLRRSRVLGLGWDVMPSWLAGVAMSTTSVAVVYAVMLEYGLNKTDYGKIVLAACFINDLGTVLALGFIFAPFSLNTLIFAAIAIAVFAILPWATPRLFKLYGNRPSELETKYLLLILFGLGALAGWADSEAVLPAYIVGMLLAGTVGKDHALIRRLRTLTLGLLTPFYFIRAGSFVSIPALIAADRLLCSPLRKDGNQVRRRVSGDQGLWCPAKGSYVHHLADVHRTDLRHHLGIVRPLARHHRPVTILCRGGRRCCKRRRSDIDRQCLLFAASLAAPGGIGGARRAFERASPAQQETGIRSEVRDVQENPACQLRPRPLRRSHLRSVWQRRTELTCIWSRSRRSHVSPKLSRRSGKTPGLTAAVSGQSSIVHGPRPDCAA